LTDDARNRPYAGTNALGRPLTDAESRELARLLRGHGFADASLIALRFAYRLTQNRDAARELVARTNLRLVEQGWDPQKVVLRKALCRFVWSEDMNDRRARAAQRRAERVHLREQAVAEPVMPGAPARRDPLRPAAREPAAPSYEQLHARLAEETEEDARRADELAEARAQYEATLAYFREQGDEVNLLWMGYFMRGITDPATMATESGHDVKEFYAATKRRARYAQRVLEAQRAAGGATTKDEERDR
jgi:hypothetical protein